MSYLFDLWGWYAGEGDGQRSVPVAPANASLTTVDGEMRSNWDGYAWIERPYVTPAPIVPAPLPPAPLEPRRITRLAFRNRFTAAEKVALEIASLDDPAASMSARQQAAMLRAYMKDVDAATHIDLSRDDTRAGVIALETAGLLGSGRALAILDAAIQSHEEPL